MFSLRSVTLTISVMFVIISSVSASIPINGTDMWTEEGCWDRCIPYFTLDQGIRIGNVTAGDDNGNAGIGERNMTYYLSYSNGPQQYYQTSEDGLNFDGVAKTYTNINPPPDYQRAKKMPDGKWIRFKMDTVQGCFIGWTSPDDITYTSNSNCRYTPPVGHLPTGIADFHEMVGVNKGKVAVVYIRNRGLANESISMAISTDNGTSFSYYGENPFPTGHFPNDDVKMFDPKSIQMPPEYGEKILFMMTIPGKDFSPQIGVRAVNNITFYTSIDGVNYNWTGSYVDPAEVTVTIDGQVLNLWSFNDPVALPLPDGSIRIYTTMLTDNGEKIGSLFAPKKMNLDPCPAECSTNVKEGETGGGPVTPPGPGGGPTPAPCPADIVVAPMKKPVPLFEEIKQVEIETDIWAIPVYDTNHIVVSSEYDGELYMRKFTLAGESAGSNVRVANRTTDTGGNKIQDHKHIYMNGYHYVLFATEMNREYILKLDNSFVRLGLQMVVDNDAPTNDPLLVGNGTHLHAAKYRPGQGYRIYVFDTSLNLLDQFEEGGNCEIHNTGASAVYRPLAVGGEIFMLAPEYIGMTNDKYYRYIFDGGFKRITERKVVMEGGKPKMNLITGLSIYKDFFIAHYCHGEDSSAINRVIFDKDWSMLSNETVYSEVQYHLPHSIVVDDMLYLGYTNQSVKLHAKLSLFNITSLIIEDKHPIISAGNGLGVDIVILMAFLVSVITPMVLFNLKN